MEILKRTPFKLAWSLAWSIGCYGLNAGASRKPIWVNVFVHGIVRPIVDISDMIQIGRQEIKKTLYKYATTYVRKENLGRHAQATQDIGLHPIQTDELDDNQGPRALVAALRTAEQALGEDQTSQLYYTFGWSGLISYHTRQKAAYFLYHKLIRLIDELEEQGLDPHIRLITYSHGGNVALQMANFDPWSKQDSQLKIDELICLAVPVQKDNDVLVRHPMFSKIYHFYSNGDIPQTLDFFTTSFGASHRRYADRECFAVPDKLTQIGVQFKHKIWHDASITRKDGYTTQSFAPNHIEMWSFGWTNAGYRRKSPIYPLPVAALTTYLTTIINRNPQLGNNLEAIVNIDDGNITFIDRKWENHRTIKKVTVPGLSVADFNSVRQAAWARRPKFNLKPLAKIVGSNAIRFATDQRKLRHCQTTIPAQQSCPF